jgi:hypothetical protein
MFVVKIFDEIYVKEILSNIGPNFNEFIKLEIASPASMYCISVTSKHN